jgi:hypothetical protein
MISKYRIELFVPPYLPSPDPSHDAQCFCDFNEETRVLTLRGDHKEKKQIGDRTAGGYSR